MAREQKTANFRIKTINSPHTRYCGKLLTSTTTCCGFEKEVETRFATHVQAQPKRALSISVVFQPFMRCLSCSNTDTKVVDSRALEEGSAIRRRRECEKCGFRFSTTEEVEILQLTVAKTDGREEPYDREKLISGMRKALEKRRITAERLKRIVNSIEQDVQTNAKSDKITSQRIGELVMKHLRRADKVAYLRFVSVCNSFDDVSHFEDELNKLTRKRAKQS